MGGYQNELIFEAMHPYIELLREQMPKCQKVELTCGDTARGSCFASVGE